MEDRLIAIIHNLRDPTIFNYSIRVRGFELRQAARAEKQKQQRLLRAGTVEPDARETQACFGFEMNPEERASDYCFVEGLSNCRTNFSASATRLSDARTTSASCSGSGIIRGKSGCRESGILIDERMALKTCYALAVSDR
jgi:hypothetical protein